MGYGPGPVSLSEGQGMAASSYPGKVLQMACPLGHVQKPVHPEEEAILDSEL